MLRAPRPEIELYDTARDPHQIRNLANRPEWHRVRQELNDVLRRWMDETGDSVPDRLRPDGFDRRLGTPLPDSEQPQPPFAFPGQDREADRISRPGPYRCPEDLRTRG